MSLLINNDLIWISVPKCASLSIEKALMDSEIDIRLHTEYRYNYEKKKLHMHLQKDAMFNEFGIHPTVCLTRDWFDRWISGFEFIWTFISSSNLTPIINWNEVDNEFIYKTFDIDFSKQLHYMEFESYNEIFKRLVNNPIVEINESLVEVLVVLLSQNYWKGNQPCTYEFDIKEINKFEEFIQKRYGIPFNIPHINSTPKLKNKIEINDELKNHIWNVFEKPFKKRNQLI
jgi:hypothetical protein